VHRCHVFPLGAPTKNAKNAVVKAIMKRANYLRRFASISAPPVEYSRGRESEDEEISQPIFAVFAVRQVEESAVRERF
jgi:hypothetical protein